MKRSARYGYSDKMMRCKNAEGPCSAEHDLVTSAEDVECDSNEMNWGDHERQHGTWEKILLTKYR